DNDFNSETPLFLAAIKGRLAALEYLLEMAFTFSSNSQIWSSMIHLSTSCMRGAITEGSDPNGVPDGLNAPPLAAGIIQVIKLLGWSWYLKRLDDCSRCLFQGFGLDPENRQLQDAFREVTLNRVEGHQCPTLDRKASEASGGSFVRFSKNLKTCLRIS
ncbi:hypothetical protein MKW98_021380, partial [Papaver atlanticum]